MPVVEDSKVGIFANPQYTPPTVEEQKKGLFANPSYGTSGLQSYESTQSSTSGPGDAEGARRQVANLEFGGAKASPPKPPSIETVKFNSGSDALANDWRVRVSIHPSSKILYYAESDPGIVGKLRDTDGVIFPYVPTVSVSHSANYGATPLTHANYANYFYE